MDDAKNQQDNILDEEKIEDTASDISETVKSDDAAVVEKSTDDEVKQDDAEAVKVDEEKAEEDVVEVEQTQDEALSEEKKDDEVSKDDDVEIAEVPPVEVTPGQWYVIHVKTSYEGRVQESLGQRIKSLGVEDKIFEIVIPVRDVIIVKKGKKTNVKEKVFPGYIFVKMILDDDSWLVVRTTQGVTGFVGAGTKPTPITEREVAAIMKFIQQEQPKFKTQFSTGEAVKIIEGPFSDFLGTVESIDDERGKVKVLVSIFDRETPVELDFLQVSKL